MTKLAVFVDVQNIYYTTKQAYQRQFNYRKLMNELSYLGEIVEANAYAIYRNDDQKIKDQQVKFQDALRHMGFEVKLKPFIQRKDGSAKGDWDVGITIDVMTAAPKVDCVVLLSGDGDFDLLLQHIKQTYQTETRVYGVPNLTADSLKLSADSFNPIDHTLLL